jgi:phage-related minor tail protein
LSIREEAVVVLRLDTSSVQASSAQASAALRKIGTDGDTGARQAAAGLTVVEGAAKNAAHGMAGMTRETLILVHELSQGRYSRFGGSLLVMAQYSETAKEALSSLIGPLGLVIAAIGAVGFAAYEGAKREEEFQNSLILTGNAAGLTSGRLMALSAAVSESSHQTIGSSRDIVTALASSGQVSHQVLAKTAEAVASVADISGESATKIAADFAKMSDGAAKWAIEHNKAWNFLTADDVQRIHSLEELGKTQEAMLLVDEKVLEHNKAQASELTDLGRALEATKRKWSEFWNAALNFNSVDTPEQRLKKAEEEVASLQSMLSKRDPTSLMTTPNGPQQTGVYLRGLIALRQEDVRLIKQEIEAENRNADTASTNAVKNKAAIKAIEESWKSATKKIKAEPPVNLDILDRWDAKIAQIEAGLKNDPLGHFIDEQVNAQNKRDDARLTSTTNYLQSMVDANDKAGIELIKDEKTRGEALIALDKSIAERRLQQMGLTGGARAQALDLINQQAGLASQTLNKKLSDEADKTAVQAGKSVHDNVRSALERAFRDSKNPATAFANALGATIFSRVTSNLANAMANALVGQNGTGGLFGSLLGSGSGGFGGFQAAF